MSVRNTPAAMPYLLAPLLAAATLGIGCEAPPPETPAAGEGATATVRAAATMADGSVCTGSGAHDMHGFPVGCVLCHACGGAYGFTPVTLPGGTSTQGGVITRGATDTTCTVACHGSQSVSWSAQGPLACSSCHDDVVEPGVVYRSMHAQTSPDAVAERSGCQGCHDTSAHTGGNVRIALGDGTYVDATNGDPAELAAACLACHDGAGNPIAGQTPPPVVAGWTSTSGDFHGVRAGTGYGGTLRAPYARGEDQLACTACHASHASRNDYLLGETVNGVPLPPELVNTAGQGAEHLCASCHEGERHQGCVDCHGVDPAPGGGTACFTCHGHEGIVVFPPPLPGNPHYTGPQENCVHCHNDWMPVVEFIPPELSGVVQVAAVGPDTATITWNTLEPATSFVEYGVNGNLNRVAGDSAYAHEHAVTLTGLEVATAYDFRVRTTDRLRNVRLTPIGTFRTFDPSAPPAPTLIPAPDLIDCGSAYELPQTLSWNAVTSPVGNPVEYRVVVDESAAFDSPTRDSGWISGTTYSTRLQIYPEPWLVYSWRVQARDAVTLAVGQWSATGQFWGAYYCGE